MGYFAIIEPIFIRKPELSELSVIDYVPYNILNKIQFQPVAFDLETYGYNPKCGEIRSISLANDHGCVAIDLNKVPESDKTKLISWLKNQRVIAHNAVYDCGWIYHKYGFMPKLEMCTLVMYKTLATEGHSGQQWGLKSAMKEVLGWAESNEVELYNWLKANKKTKAAMADAPWEILGPYNALDSYATWELYKHFKNTVSSYDWGEALTSFHENEIKNEIELFIEQQYHGMHIDQERFLEFDEYLKTEIEKYKTQFLTHPLVHNHILEYQKSIVEALEALEPPQFTKTGAVQARYIKWQEKVKQAKDRIDFNINSSDQLRWLLIERIGLTTNIVTDSGEFSLGKKALPEFGELGEILKNYRLYRDRRKFVTSLSEIIIDSKFYPTLKMHGTVSGRASGGLDG